MTKRKKIHIVHVVYGFVTGGLENGLVNIINNLPKDAYKHTIISINSHDPIFASRLLVKDVQLIDLKKPSGNSYKWLLSCWKLFFRMKPDIVHSRNLSALESQLAAFFAGVPHRIHGEHGWDVSDLGGCNPKYQKLRRFFKPLIHQYVALSLEAVEYLASKIAVKPSKINHICNGVDISKFQPNKNRIQLPRGFANDDSIIFGTVGRLAEVKNQTFLVSAFLEMWQKSAVKSQLKLVIIGDGILRPRLEEMVVNANATSAVWFAGQRNDVNELLTQLDVFVLPSLAEGISNTLLEAMASGLPYIATHVGGNADLVLPQHKQSHIVEVNNTTQLISAMTQYVDAPNLIAQDSALVREHCVNHFSIEAMVGKYHRLYQLANR